MELREEVEAGGGEGHGAREEEEIHRCSDDDLFALLKHTHQQNHDNHLQQRAWAREILSLHCCIAVLLPHETHH